MIANPSIQARKNRFATLRTLRGIERNHFAKKCLEKIEYAPDEIAISFSLKQELTQAPDDLNPFGFSADVKNYAPDQKNNYAPKSELPNLQESREFAKYMLYSPSDLASNFQIISPNFIHGSRQMNIS